MGGGEGHEGHLLHVQPLVILQVCELQGPGLVWGWLCIHGAVPQPPRHIKVQIIGDGRENFIHLWEWDCLVQWHH